MTTVAVTMVKDEADIIATTVGHMLTQADCVIVADNLSTDDTRPILDDLAARHTRLLVVDDPNPAYEQSAKMTALAHRARHEFGAEWVIPFDADEIWYSPFHDRIADHLAEIADQWLAVPARVYDHVATSDDDDLSDPVARIGWRRLNPLPLHKVACRYRSDLTIEMGNHAASYAGGTTIHDPCLVVRHFPYRSVDQLIRKVRNGAAAYKLTDMDPEQYGAHWRQWGQFLDQDGPQAIADLFYEWYWSEQPGLDPLLIFDPAPVRSPA